MCVVQTTLRARINVVNVSSQLSILQQQVQTTLNGGELQTDKGNKAHMAQLVAKANNLKQKLDLITNKIDEVNRLTKKCEYEAKQVVEATASFNTASNELKEFSNVQFNDFVSVKISKERHLERAFKDMLHLSLGLQTKLCSDLLRIFSLKKKRKKVGYEIVLGFNIIPELSKLGNYSQTTINSGLERVCNFILLLASYLGIRLPYDLVLMKKSQPYVLIGAVGDALVLPHSVKTMMRSSAKEFHQYCKLMAMLCVNVAHVAVKLGVPGILDVGDVAKMHQLIAQIYLRLESLIRNGHQIKVYSGQVPVDLDSVQDHLITSIDIEMNGKSAEFIIIDAPSDQE